MRFRTGCGEQHVTHGDLELTRVGHDHVIPSAEVELDRRTLGPAGSAQRALGRRASDLAEPQARAGETTLFSGERGQLIDHVAHPVALLAEHVEQLLSLGLVAVPPEQVRR